ncbi:hypothetical protein GpartN1_g1386.t1 [Galdieria partita]|uniref:non-specific serine/threonine protein kinase n=1 Tax=Galdieria partita TaxID=83374 RepID=A0A9C7UNJ7_9RHOD|nr:hypothetical protein GpartN1_g1386.t1 [Galdieria partita]
MKASLTKLWFLVALFWLCLLSVTDCSKASEAKPLIFPNVSSNALVPKATLSKHIYLDKTCPFLFLELLDGSIELLHAVQGFSLWSIKSEKIFLPNKEEQPSALDRCILGPDYRLYILKEDGMVPYFLGNSESLLTLYRVDTSALLIELDTGRILKEIEFYSEEEPFPIPCMEGNDNSCAYLFQQYQVKNLGIVFRKFVGLRMYDANTGKSHFANFSRFEPSNFLFTNDRKVSGTLDNNVWYGKLFIDVQQVSLKDEGEHLLWSRSFETPVMNIIALGDMFKKESKPTHNDWISFSSLKMISDVPNTDWHIEAEEPIDGIRFSISYKHLRYYSVFLKQYFILLVSVLIGGLCTLLFYYWKELVGRLFVFRSIAPRDSSERKKDGMKWFLWRILEKKVFKRETNSHYSFGNGDKSITEEYKIGKLILTHHILGLGSHGTVVFEGRLDRDGRKVAIKRMLKTFYDLARKEIEMLIKLDELSPYVIHYYAMEEDQLFVYLALELCDRTLEEQVRLWQESTQVSSYCYVPILRQIMYGLMDLHRYGVVHRDLKPQNILIIEPKKYSLNDELCCEHYRIKIADVGLAKKMNTETTLACVTNGNSTSNKAEGSLGWRAAEVLNKEKQNTSLDIFAAGCILFFVLTGGKHPFGDSIYERESKICKGDYNLKELEKLQLWDAKDLIEKMIALDPLTRPSARQVLKHPLFWSDTKKLSFLSDVSDRLSFFKNGNGSKENTDLIVSFEKYCRVALASIETRRISWATRIDMSVLKAPNSRNYDTSSVSDLLRLIRNKRSHYNELPSSVQQILGILPCYDREENLNHNFWQYFNRRFPKLLITVYSFVTERIEFLQDTHFVGYGMNHREWVRYDEEENTEESTTRQENKELTKPEMTRLQKKERKKYSFESLLKLKQSNFLPLHS